MIGNKRVLGLIPARGGSKGIRRKNLRLLAGRPLLAWTVDAARGSQFLDRVVLTTEDEEIAQVARSLGAAVPFLRPHELATDSAHVVDVIRHALTALEEPFDYVMLLEPTSPLRTSADIDGCLKALHDARADYATTVCPSPYRPEWMFYLTPESRLDPVIGRFDARPRQELPPCYIFNGSVYAARVDAFLRDMTLSNEQTIAYVMPSDRSADINEEADLAAAEAMLLNRFAMAV